MFSCNSFINFLSESQLLGRFPPPFIEPRWTNAFTAESKQRHGSNILNLIAVATFEDRVIDSLGRVNKYILFLVWNYIAERKTHLNCETNVGQGSS